MPIIYQHDVVESANKLREDDIIVAIMGPTGSGKSHILDTLIGQAKYAVSDLHAPSSKGISAIRIKQHDAYGDRLVILDTPGFDTTQNSDLEILQMISKWLIEVHNRNICIKGIIYLHRITDTRMAGSPNRNLRVMGELCGDKGAAGVVLVTTMWDLLKNPRIGEAREQDLIRNFWCVILDHGATSDRFKNTPESAWSIIHRLVSKNTTNITLLIQEEIAELGLALAETKAAQGFLVDLHRLQVRQKQQLATLKSLSKLKPCPISQQELVAKMKAMEEQITNTADIIEQLQVSVGRKIVLFFKPSANGRALEIKREDYD